MSSYSHVEQSHRLRVRLAQTPQLCARRALPCNLSAVVAQCALQKGSGWLKRHMSPALQLRKLAKGHNRAPSARWLGWHFGYFMSTWSASCTSSIVLRTQTTRSSSGSPGAMPCYRTWSDGSAVASTSTGVAMGRHGRRTMASYRLSRVATQPYRTAAFQYDRPRARAGRGAGRVGTCIEARRGQRRWCKCRGDGRCREGEAIEYRCRDRRR